MKRKRMKLCIANVKALVLSLLTFWLTLSFFFTQCYALDNVIGHVVISEVFYDPEGSDDGKEFVELYNPMDQDINLSGYRLQRGNGAMSGDWLTEWTGTHEVIKANNYFLIGESNVTPTPDFLTDLDLQNSDDAVRLLFNNSIIDLVGYGNNFNSSEYYEGMPAPEAHGKSLHRIKWQDTDNNSNDFFVDEPSPMSASSNEQNASSDNNSASQKNLTAVVTITNSAPEIIKATVTDDFPLIEGFQVIPSPGNKRQVEVEVSVKDKNRAEDIRLVTAALLGKAISLNKSADINESSALYSGSFFMDFYTPPGNYTINVTASDLLSSSSTTVTFEYKAIIALELDTSIVHLFAEPGKKSTVRGDDNIATRDKPTIRNIGNTVLNVLVRGDDLKSGKDEIPAGNLRYSFDGTNFESSLAGAVSKVFVKKEISLAPGEYSTRAVSLEILAPLTVPAGNYSTTIELIAVS